MVQQLLRRGADPNSSDSKTGAQPLALAAFTQNLAITRLLLKAGASPNARGPGGQTPLAVACHKASADDLSLVSALHNSGQSEIVPLSRQNKSQTFEGGAP